MKKRILSVVLALVMVAGLTPSFTITAMAAGEVTLLVNTSAADDNATRGVGAQYKTLAGAVTNAASGDTIKFETNCTIGATVLIEGKTLTLDLNDKLITCDVNTTFTYYAINVGNGGTLTVTDTANGLGKIQYSTPIVTTSNGTVNVAGGTIEANSAGKGPAIQNSTIDATINVSGGTVSLDIGGSESYGAINSFGTVNVSGGTVVGTGNTPAIKSSGTVNVTGGNINILSIVTSSTANVTGGSINLLRIHSGCTAYVTGGNINSIYNDGTLQNLNSQSVCLYTFTGGDPNVEVSSLSVTPALGYTYGLNDVKTDGNGKIYVWLPTGITNASVTAGGKNMTIDFRIRGEEITGLILPSPGMYGQMYDFYGNGYSGYVTWSPSATPFQPGTVYTGTLTLTAVDSYTFTGMTGTFTVSGATSVTVSDNTGNTLKLTAVFPETESPQAVTVAVKKDGGAWIGHGKSFALFKDGFSNYVLNSSGYNASVLPGTYDIYDGAIDTGVDITVSNGGANTATVNYYTVTFKSQDGSATLDTKTVLSGKTASYGGTTPTKTADAQYSYDFSKWVTEANGTTEATLSNITTPTIVYASFTPTLRSYTITWKKDSTTTIDTTTVAYGSIPSHADATKPGYNFGGWTPAIGSVTGDATYTANWTADSYNITYQLNGGNVSTGNPASYTIDSAAITLNNPTRDGYSFVGWSGTDLTGNTNQSVTIASNSTGNKAYTANWKADVPLALEASVVTTKNSTTLTISTTAGYEYSLDGTNWYSGTNDSYTFTGLNSGQAYNLVCRKAAVTTVGNVSAASDPSPALTVTTKNGAPASPTLAFESITVNSVTITAVDGAEYSKDNGANWQDSNEFSGLESATKYFFAIRIKETVDTLESNKTSEEKYTLLPILAAEDANYDNMTQAVATDETVIEVALKTTADTAINDNSVDVTINKKGYTEPIVGTSANPTGTNGSYTFTVTLSKGGQTDETAEIIIVISATAFTGVSDVDAVAAAKTSIVDGTVTVAFGADQTAKTAAVQSYVDGLLTGDAVGVTATVTYNSETNNYDVEISKGSVNDSTTIAMTIVEDADPDIVTVNNAKNAAESAIYLDMTQAVATEETVIETALKAAAESAVNNDTVNVTVTKESYTAPIEGTSADPAGINGSYVFKITVSKGAQTRFTSTKTIVIVATPYVEIPTYKIIGIVQDGNSNNVLGATVKLMHGQNQVGLSAQTDADGKFTIENVINGTYNLVVSKNGITVTMLVVVNNANNTLESAIILPSGKTNSVVEVNGSQTPKIVVGNLDGQFSSTATENDKGVTSEDETVVANSGSVEIKLIAEKKDGTATNATTISAIATSSGKTVGIFMDLSVLKTVRDSGGAEITSQSAILKELTSLIDIYIPLPTTLQGKSNYVVYRYHGSAVDSITTMANTDGEKIELVDNNTTIKLTVKKFSTYGIAYTTPSSNNSGGGSSSSAAAAAITAEQSEGGKITISTDKKTVTMTPDDGYVIADVMVDGKSIGATEKYTFTDIKNHKITAAFVKKTTLPYYIKNGDKVYIGFSAIAGNLYKYISPTGETVEFRENPKNFTDNTTAWAKPSIDFVTEREIFLGTSQDTFSPNESMTRAMFVTAIGRLYERSYGSVSGVSNFSDVDTNAYYAKYVAWANEKGLIKGMGENMFAPDEKVTREQMAVIMLNFANLLKKVYYVDGSLGYIDSTSISSWAIDGAKYCQETKVITGREGGSFIPQGNATRAEVAVVLERFVKTIVQ